MIFKIISKFLFLVLASCNLYLVNVIFAQEETTDTRESNSNIDININTSTEIDYYLPSDERTWFDLTIEIGGGFILEEYKKFFNISIQSGFMYILEPHFISTGVSFYLLNCEANYGLFFSYKNTENLILTSVFGMINNEVIPKIGVNFGLSFFIFEYFILLDVNNYDHFLFVKISIPISIILWHYIVRFD